MCCPQAYAALLLLRQSACALAEHGARVAHLFCSHMCDKMPRVGALLGSALAALKAAHDKVRQDACASLV